MRSRVMSPDPGGRRFPMATSLSDSTQPADTLQLVQQLLGRVQRLEDTLEIQKVQSEYLHLLFKQRFERIVDECFAKHVADVSVEFSDSGVYRGLESIRSLYKAFEATRRIPGFFILHMTTNPV